ncbi:hypothetical protein PCH70_32390 [Pseudomonas cichorii JBC1]|nr:hypothetical protein PCH70_32390 [Pseudomonas cichorii JBC1]
MTLFPVIHAVLFLDRMAENPQKTNASKLTRSQQVHVKYEKTQ